ncbi:MAG: protein kinase [Nocardioides sp.]
MAASPGHPGLPRVGDRFGRYLIDAEVGRGGMGVVYRATDTTTRRTVALKVVSAELASSEELLRRFDREAEVLAQLRSPHVIASYDHGTHEGRPYIATQLAAGGDLGALIHQRGPMPARLAVRVCAQVAEALAEAHAIGVVHHDVKPTNVLLRDADELDLHAYLCDFGIAHVTHERGDGEAPSLVAATWSYLAPECGAGEPGTPASDVYALGCLLWATLSGAPPYRGTDDEIAQAHREAAIPQLTGDDEFSVRVNAILGRTMAKDPADRYDDLAHLRDDLLVAAGESLPETDADVTASPVTPARVRRPRAVAAAGLVGLLLVAMVAASRAANDDDAAVDRPGPTPSTSAPATADTTTETSGETSGETTGPTTTAPPTPASGVTGDLDGDGLGDVSVDVDRTVRRAGSPTSLIESTTWTSTGTALERGRTTTLDEGGDSYAQRVTGQFDGDGVLDVLVARTFGDGPRLVVSGDLSGGGSVNSELSHPGDRNLFAHVADIDGDGLDDLLFTSLLAYDRGGVEVLASRFDGSAFADPTLALSFKQNSDRQTLGFGDVDGDGTDDIVALYNRDQGGTELESRLRVYRGKRGTFAADGERRLVTSAAAPMRLADVDDDGDAEIVVVDDEPGRVRLGIVDRVDRVLKRPVWSPPIRLVPDVVPGIGVSDVDGDGRDDIVVVGPVDSLAEAELRVARSASRGFEVTSWATWPQRFNRFGSDAVAYIGESLL